MEIDLYFMDMINKIRSGFLDGVFTNVILGKIIYIWIALIVVLICIRKTRKLGIIIAISFLGTLLLGEGVLKKLIARPRPFITYGYEVLIKKPTSFSFPSGSTALSFAVFGSFLFLKNKYSIFVGLIALIVAISRVYLGVHYVTDVIGAMFLGILISYFSTKILVYLKIDKAYKRNN